MKPIRESVLALAAASHGNPIVSSVTVITFYVMFSFLEASAEKLIFGHRFEHWLDPIFIIAFMAYAAYSVYGCAIYNSQK